MYNNKIQKKKLHQHCKVLFLITFLSAMLLRSQRLYSSFESRIKGDLDTIGLAILILGQMANLSICQGTPNFTENSENTPSTIDFICTKYH